MENLHSYRCTAEQNRLYLPYYHDLCSLWRKGTVPPMKGRMKPYLPELTIRDYNIYLQYLRGVRRQLYTEFGWYSCHLLRHNGVVFAILSDSLAGRTATCQRQRVPGTLCWRRMIFAAEFGDPVVAQHLVDILIRTREFVDIFRNRLEKAPDIDLLDPVGIGDPEVLRAQAVVRLAQDPGQAVEFVVRLAEGLLHGAELPVARASR